ncbi:MAG: hypothetical protein RBQ99_10420 [Trichlorobacter sp.]|nr:hypothetical protein [Trichlorobacter sp.]
MKKLLLTLAIAAPLAFASFSYADDPPEAETGEITDVDFGQAGGQIVGTGSGDDFIIGRLSSGVALGANTAAGGYAIITVHKNGTKAFGTAHDSTAIYSANINKADIGKEPEITRPAAASADGSFYTLDEDDGSLSAEDAVGDFATGAKWTAM